MCVLFANNTTFVYNQRVLKVMFSSMKKGQNKKAQILTEMIPSFRLLQSINTQSIVIDDSQKSIHCLQTCAHVCHSLLNRQNEEAAAGIVSAETIIILATFDQPAPDREHTSANPMHYPIMWPSSPAPAAVFLHCYSSTNRTPQPSHSTPGQKKQNHHRALLAVCVRIKIFLKIAFFFHRHFLLLVVEYSALLSLTHE